MILSSIGIIAGSKPFSTLNTNLFAVYKAESNANDSLGAYNGTAQGGLTYTTGKSGSAFTGNGTNAFVSMANNSFNFTGDFSISLWVYINNTAPNQELFCNTDYNVGASGVKDLGYRVQYLGLNNTIRSTIYTSGGAVALTCANYSIILQQWAHVVVTRKAGTRTRIYINGILSTSNTSILNPTYTANYTGVFVPCIGAYKSIATPQTVNYLASGSKIDEVELWDKELTQAEVTELQTKFYPF